MAVVLSSNSSWKCLGYPPQALKTRDELVRELNTHYADDFSRYDLGPDWGIIHYDNDGSVTLDGTVVTVSVGSAGAFESVSDTGSMIYKRLPSDWTAVEVDITNVSINLAYQAMLMLRAGLEANAPFYAIRSDSDRSHLTTLYRDSYGASAIWPGDNTGITWDKTKPLRLRIERSGSTLTAKLSYNGGGTWSTIASRSMPEMKYACLCAGKHNISYVIYDNFAVYGASSSNIAKAAVGFQLATVPGSGQYVSPPFSLYGFKATGIPTILWDGDTTGVTMSIDVSLDGGTTWSGWQPASSGDPLPGTDANTNLDNVKFRYRLELTADGPISPVISNIRIANLIDWTDPAYEDSTWAGSYDNGAYNTSSFSSLISAWPDTAARWIWDRASTSSAPRGYVYFRKRFTLPVGLTITIGGACDDMAEVYVDGALACGETSSMFSTVLDLTAGEHVIAVRAYNQGAAAGLILTVRTPEAGITARTAIASRTEAVLSGVSVKPTACTRVVKASAGMNIGITCGTRNILVLPCLVTQTYTARRNQAAVPGRLLKAINCIRRERNLVTDIVIFGFYGGTGGTSGLAPELALRKKPLFWVPPLHARWKQKPLLAQSDETVPTEESPPEV